MREYGVVDGGGKEGDWGLGVASGLACIGVGSLLQIVGSKQCASSSFWAMFSRFYSRVTPSVSIGTELDKRHHSRRKCVFLIAHHERHEQLVRPRQWR